MQEAIDQFKKGNPVIVLDDISRENEADIIIPAQFATAEMINKFIRNSTGIICVPMAESRAVELGLTQMVSNNTDPNRTNYTVSCDSIECSTGVSAEDRTKTILTLADPQSTQKSIRQPGHLFPLVCKPGLLNDRRGHTEASIQLCLLAGLIPVSAIVELMNPDGTMSRYEDVKKNSNFENVPIITIDEIINYTKTNFNIPKPLLKTSDSNLTINVKNKHAEFEIILFRDEFTTEEICVIKHGKINQHALTRIHSECFTGNTLHSLHCDCEQQFLDSLEAISNHSGIVLYMRNHEGRGIGLFNKLKAYKLQQEQKLDTIEANLELGLPIDNRNYDMAIRVLEQLGIKNIKLMTNNPDKFEIFRKKFNCEIVNVESKINEFNRKYLETKKVKMNHKSIEIL